VTARCPGRGRRVVPRHRAAAGPGEVTVSPAGVFHRSLTHIHFVPWYAITEVEARWRQLQQAGDNTGPA
jgi:hypothetical protein